MTVTVNPYRWWIGDPTDAGSFIQIAMQRGELSSTTSERNAVYPVMGARAPVVLSDAIGTPVLTLAMTALTDGTWTKLKALRQRQTPLLLKCPTTTEQWYLRFGADLTNNLDLAAARGGLIVRQIAGTAQIVNPPAIQPWTLNAWSGGSLHGFGHSYMAGTAGADHPWLVEAANQMGLAGDDRGFGGDRMVDTYSRMVGNQRPQWDLRCEGPVVVESELNDVRFSSSPVAVTGFKWALRAVLTLLGATVPGGPVTQGVQSDVANGQTAAYHGSWAVQTGVYAFLGGLGRYTSTQGDYVDLNVLVPSSGEVAVIVAGTKTTTGATVSFALDPFAANTTITPAGGSAGSINLSNQCVDDSALGTAGGQALGYVPVPLRFTGLPAGPHTIRMTKTDATGTVLSYNAWLVPSGQCQRIIVCKDPDIGAAAWALGAPYNNGSSAALATYHAAIDAVVAEYPALPITVVNLGTGGWTTPGDQTTIDNIHPNNSGVLHLAAAFLTQAGSLVEVGR